MIRVEPSQQDSMAFATLVLSMERDGMADDSELGRGHVGMPYYLRNQGRRDVWAVAACVMPLGCFSRSFCAVACVDRTRAEAPRYFDNKHNYTRKDLSSYDYFSNIICVVGFACQNIASLEIVRKNVEHTLPIKLLAANDLR